ncbi:MAG TPA: prohibitin family protein [Longimicrobium sp.]|nr:prohibitin family protein [Longimicrobium sp.]
MDTLKIPLGKRGRPSSDGPGRMVRGIGSKWAWIVAAVALVILVRSMAVYVAPGNVGIVIHKLGGGVDPKPKGPGLHFRNPLTTGIEEYPTYMQTLVLTRGATDGSATNDEINVNSVEGQPVSLDVSLSFELEAARVPTLYSTFRTDIQSIQHGFVRQTMRQALQEVVGGQEIAAILGPKKAEVVNRAQTLLSSRLAPYGFIVKQFTVNEIRAPQGVMDAIGAKNVMQQQALMAQNELQKNMYQAQGDSIKAAGRAMAILAEARAQAEANQLLSQSITQTLVQYEMTKRWDGKMPQVSGSAIPMIQLPGQQ